MKKRIVSLPGDGIGPEVNDQAIRVLKACAGIAGFEVEIDEHDIGGISIDKHGVPLTETAIKACKAADAVLLGAVGGPKWDNLEGHLRPEAGLLGIRKALGLFTNLRPVKVFDALRDASTLKPEVIAGVDLLVVRELTGGLYFGQPKGPRTVDGREDVVDTMAYTEAEVERIAHAAFRLAGSRRKKVTSVDKANVLATSRMWRSVVERVAGDYPGIELEHMLVDNCAMQLVRNPRQFDVVVTENMFGDILSDEAAMLTGSIGMLPSASLGESGGLYEPVHGSAPDIAGQNKANPLAAIASVGLMLRYSFGEHDVADLLDKALEGILSRGWRCADIPLHATVILGTEEMGDAVVEDLFDFARLNNGAKEIV
ncbi:MAG: 3-isopropylmalate dehydrogenase [Rhodothermaceae bacterium]|nr:3-isopropylmalate dehydrogenase [Rhodothermaceae bacterium]